MPLLAQNVNLYFKQSLTHDNVYSFAFYIVAMYASDDLLGIQQTPHIMLKETWFTLRMDSTRDRRLTVPTAADGKRGVK